MVEGERGDRMGVQRPPLDWYAKELLKECNQVCITMGNRLFTVKEAFMRDNEAFKEGTPLFGLLLESVRHFTAAAYHAGAMDSLLTRNAGRMPNKPRDPVGPDDAFAQFHVDCPPPRWNS